MEAIKQIVRIPENHEIKIKIPRHVPENEIMEVILIIKERPSGFQQKIEELKEAAKDNLFLDDIIAISEDFRAIDQEGWGQEDGV